ASWDLLPIETSLDNTGLYSSIAIDASGRPHIAFQNGTTSDLMYAVGVSATGVGDAPRRATASVHIAPNPSRGGKVALQWSGPRTGATAFEIFDLHGRQVRRIAIDGSGR